MAKYTLQERLVIVQNVSFVNTQRALRETCGPHYRPSVLAIRRIIKIFKKNFTLHNAKIPTGSRNARNVENIAVVRHSVAKPPNLSILHCNQELGLRKTASFLGLHPYKFLLTQELTQLDHRKRYDFTTWALGQLETDKKLSSQMSLFLIKLIC